MGWGGSPACRWAGSWAQGQTAGLGKVRGRPALLQPPQRSREPSAPRASLVLTTVSFLSLRWEGLVLIILYVFYILIMK